ncbi:MAG: fenitrothion hydrolase [Actinobacteria bacterium]|nr:fenitrothion hydrolase [Actinomycetota bacterium]
MIVLAHGLSGRSDLPIPDWLFGWAAALVLAVSFFAFAALWQQPKLETARATARLRIPVLLGPLCGGTGVLLFAGLVYAGFAGTQVESLNVLPSFLYVFVWSALPLICALLGDVFRAFNPWAAVGRFSRWVQRRVLRRRPEAFFDYPERLGCWPAVVFPLMFGYLELISPHGRDPSVLAALMLAYAAVQLAGMSLFGVDRWLERGDAFGVYFAFFAKLAPLTVVGCRLATRLPLSGLTDVTWVHGTVFFVCAAIGVTAFDGAAEGGLWQSIAEPLASVGSDLGMSVVTSGRVVETLGLIAMVLLIAGFYRLGVEGMVSSHIDKPARELSRIFAPSLVPIMLAYVIAHYFSFIAFQGQALWPLLSDPLGDGSDLFGTAGAGVDYGWLSSAEIWYAQVAALVLGHAAGLAVAHDKALAVWGKAGDAVRSQLWMLVVMVGFTNLGLWLLSQANQ